MTFWIAAAGDYTREFRSLPAIAGYADDPETFYDKLIADALPDTLQDLPRAMPDNGGSRKGISVPSRCTREYWRLYQWLPPISKPRRILSLYRRILELLIVQNKPGNPAVIDMIILCYNRQADNIIFCKLQPVKGAQHKHVRT